MLTIYGVPISVHARKAIIAARLKGIDHTVDPVIPFNPPEGWRSISPTGLIPAMSHDGFTLADSNAICAYMERLVPTPSIYPPNAQACGRALWLEQYATTVLFKTVLHPLFFQKIIKPKILGQGGPDEGEIRRVRESVAPVVFEYLERQIADDFFVGGDLSIADIAVASNLINYGYLGFRVDAGDFPRLAKTFARIVATPALRDALSAEAPVAEQMGLDRSFLA